MRIAVMNIDARMPAVAIADAQQAEREGFQTYYIPGGWRDSLTLAALAGYNTERVSIGTNIVATWASPPVVLAEQALTVNAACGGRLSLGVGVSHKGMVADRYGLSLDRPTRHLREYLEILMPLLHTGKVDVTGELFSAHTELRLPDAQPPEVLIAALGPQSLAIAGRLADGTITGWAGPRTLERDVVPALHAAASAAGRPTPRVVTNLPMLLSKDVDSGRERAAEIFDAYRTRYTTYQATFEREGVSGPAGVAMIGDETELRRQLAHLESIGVNEYMAYFFGDDAEVARTRAFLQDVANGG